jgi:hypothetical protein
MGSEKTIANELADAFGFPYGSGGRDDLRQVAQFLSVQLGERQARDEVIKRQLAKIAEKLKLPDDAGERTHDALLEKAFALPENAAAFEPVVALARAPATYYVTTSATSVLEMALIREGKKPHLEVCQWYLDREASSPEANNDYVPSVEEPLVFHAFGSYRTDEENKKAEKEKKKKGELSSWETRSSVPYSEDDYIDHIIGFTKTRSSLSTALNSRLTRSMRLLLGFSMNDIRFKILYQTLVNLPGAVSGNTFRHLAVQIDPEDDILINPTRAKRFLEKYFTLDSTDVFWGSIEDFAETLSAKLKGSA